MLTVLAGTNIEGRRLLADLGIRGGVVFDRASAMGRRWDVVLELPSWSSNPARHAVESVLRYERDICRMLVEPAERPAPAPAAPHQTTIEEQIALAESDPAPEPSANAAEPTRSRYQPHSKSKAAKAARRQAARS